MSWDPEVDIGQWGRLQIVIDDTDVTFFRDVPVQVVSWSSGDPFDDASCVLRFPQVSPFERAGVGELSWLKGHNLVDINLIRPNGNKRVLWEGMIASIEDDVSETNASVSLQCVGALFQLDYYVKSPENLSEKKQRLYERAIADEFSPPKGNHEALKTSRCRIVYPEGMEDTDWYTRYSGAWEKTLTGYIQRLLADMVHNPGLIKEPGSPEIPGIPGATEVQEIVLAPEPPPWPWGSSYPSASLNGTFRLEFRGARTPGRTSKNALRWNATATQVQSALNALSTIDEVQVSGNGTSGSPWRVSFVGSKVRQRPQPLIKLIHSDLRHHHPSTRVTRATAGDNGIPGTPAVPPSDPEPWEGAWTLLKNPGRRPVLKLRDEASVSWTISAGAPGVSHSLKSDYSQTPSVIFGEGTDESATTWRNSTVSVDRKGESTTHHHPVAWEEAVYPADKRRSESGEPTDPRPIAYHPGNVRVEIMQKYGSGVSLLDAGRSADQQLVRESDPGWFGKITLTSDPEEGSRFEIKAGTNLRLRHFREMIPARKEIFEELRDRGIFTEQFHSTPITRGKACAVLVRMMADLGQPVPSYSGSNLFTDISGNIYASHINRLANINVARGYANTTRFGPNDHLTRGQMAGFAIRLVEWATGTSLTSSYNHFNDSVSGTFRREINAGMENELVTGYPNNAFYPNREASRLEMSETVYLVNRFLGGDILDGQEGAFLHIASVEVNFESGTVDLTVDSKSRDLATLAQLIERTKSENQDPAKMLMVNRESGQTDDTKFPWDYDAGSGSLPSRSRAARHTGALPRGRPDVNPDWFVFVNGNHHDPWKRWAVVPMVAAGKGSVSRSEVRAFTQFGQPLEIPFHVGIYGLYITEYSMPRLPFQPDAFRQPADTGDALSGYDPSALVLWGQQGQRAGFWPGLESEGNPVTGIMIDEGTWQFQLPEGENVLWVAIYAETNAWFQGRFYHGVQ